MLFNRDCSDEYGLGWEYESCDFYDNPHCREIVLHLKKDRWRGEFAFKERSGLPDMCELHAFKAFKRYKIPVTTGYMFYVRRNPDIPEVLFIPLSERSVLTPGRQTTPRFELVDPESPGEGSPGTASLSAQFFGRHVGQR